MGALYEVRMDQQMTGTEFLSSVEKYHNYHPTLRYGQSIMNCLWSLNPELYEEVCINKLDVYHTTDATDIAQTVLFVSTRLQSLNRSAV